MRSTTIILIAFATLFLAALPVEAQRARGTKAFKPGDIYLAAASTGGSCLSGAPGIVRLSPHTFVPEILTTLSVGTRWVRYDPFRDRLLAYAILGSGSFGDILFVTANGTVTPLPGSNAVNAVDAAPTGRGVIYLNLNAFLWYLDSGDSLHPVIDPATGGTYYLGQLGQTDDDIVYSSKTNSIYYMSHESCPPSDTVTAVHQLVLSPNGTSVVGTTGPITVGTCRFGGLSMDPGPPGNLLITTVESCCGNMQSYLVSASTLSSRLFASSSPGSGIRYWDGAYSNALGGAIVWRTQVYGGPYPNALDLHLDGSSGLGFTLYQDSSPNYCPFIGVSDIEVIRYKY